MSAVVAYTAETTSLTTDNINNTSIKRFRDLSCEQTLRHTGRSQYLLLHSSTAKTDLENNSVD